VKPKLLILTLKLGFCEDSRCKQFKNRILNKKLKFGFLIFGVVILIGFILKGNISHEEFDSEKWKNWTESNSEDDLSLRWDMMNSLRKSEKLKGKTKTEIIELLGKPSREENFTFSYNLGPSKRGINYGHLDLYFNEKEIVTDFKVGEG